MSNLLLRRKEVGFWFRKFSDEIYSRFSAPIILLFAFLLISIPISYQNDTPVWKDNLNCTTIDQKYKGIEYCTSWHGDSHIIVLDLHESGLRMEYIIAEGLNRFDKLTDDPSGCRDVNVPEKSTGPGCYDPRNKLYYPVMSLQDAVVRNPNAAVIINTDYGAGTQDEPISREHGPEGLAIVQGTRIDGPSVGDIDNNAENRPWLAIGKNTPLRIEFDQLSPGEDNGSSPDWVYTGIGGAPWLIRNGQIDDEQVKNCINANPWSCISTEAQTAVAISENGRWLYFIVASGKDAIGTAQFLYEELHPWQAIKFDGGGSSQLWYGGLQSDQPESRIVYPGDGRKLSQYLAIFADPGLGIVLNETPEFQENPKWWEHIAQEIVNWFEQIPQKIETSFQQILEEVKENIAEWLETQIKQKLYDMANELCGTAAIPGVIALSLVVKKHRRGRNNYANYLDCFRFYRTRLNKIVGEIFQPRH